MRKHRSFSIPSSLKIKDALLKWSEKYTKIAWLDSNGHSDAYSTYDAILAIAEQTDKSSRTVYCIDELSEFIDKEHDWLFGYLSYDLKNRIERLSSNNFDGLKFPEIHFFQPSKIIAIKDEALHFLYLNSHANQIEGDYSTIKVLLRENISHNVLSQAIHIKMRIHKDAYFEKANRFLEHIHRGDIYEANFCQEFYAENTTINAFETFRKLNAISKPPFASFLKSNEHYLLCASPERYLKRMGQAVISQPIKGTAPRGKTQIEDESLQYQLENDEKERAENIMITDLVRNDLSKSAVKGSVEVKELCKVYAFEQVHQMISTVVSKVPKNKKSFELIQETFPMGSMTGAPKVSAMKIIEALEETKRGLYSGAVGYFDPNGNFDFNVVIRSILYNEIEKYVSFSVGSAITAKSNPEKEYQECLLKAKAMRSVLEGS
ncbi:anthranilate synthase component I family protein [Flagellimonas sp. 389]|uniref:anthranilate synthase component I family protein n=1 Tax=Flagellimonas sp. 389 TaxID=2835862 RepID=UPI001BD4B09A|nr:anthranilate synthase component I family protein [Flagellimonas sp. 389]MBS9463007.1 anthranilate synthase component I family protein [Flagellimonas sp. 389]